jgi:hypothetical protein
MSFLNSIFGKKKQKPGLGAPMPAPAAMPAVLKPAHIVDLSEDAGVPLLASACRGLPFQATLDVSPDESLVCCVTLEKTVAAYESGSDHAKWTLSVTSSRNSGCAFVGPERLLVLSPNKMDEPLIPLLQLVDTVNGKIVAEKLGPRMSSKGDADLRTGQFVADALFNLVVVQTAGDKIEFSSLDSGQTETSPKIGPDGKCYVTLPAMGLYRIDENGKTPIMPGKNCIHFEPPNQVYCGGGHYDRSGASALNIANLETNVTSAIPWGFDPVYQIASAGKDCLLIASCSGGSMSRRDSAVVTLFSLVENKKVWSFEVNDLPQGPNIYRVLLTSAPEEGWAFIQTGNALKVIALEDGKVIRRLPKEPQVWTWAKWLASRKLLYLGGNPYMERPGLLECFRI